MIVPLLNPVNDSLISEAKTESRRTEGHAELPKAAVNLIVEKVAENQFHSALKATIGSTFVARHAGI